MPTIQQEIKFWIRQVISNLIPSQVIPHLVFHGSLNEHHAIQPFLQQAETSLQVFLHDTVVQLHRAYRNYVQQVHPNARKFQFSGISPELEEKLDMMFRQVVATGHLAWASNSRNFEHESIDEHDLSDGEETQNMNELSNFAEARRKPMRKGKMANKRARSSTMDEIAETSRIIGRCMAEPPHIQISSSLYNIPDAIAELESMTEVMSDSNYDFYDYCTMFLREKHNRETFMSIQKDRQLRWLQARYEK